METEAPEEPTAGAPREKPKIWERFNDRRVMIGAGVLLAVLLLGSGVFIWLNFSGKWREAQKPEPSTGKPLSIEEVLSRIDKSASLPGSPAGEFKTLNVSGIEVKYYTPLVSRGEFEPTADILITTKNTTASPGTLYTTGTRGLEAQVPKDAVWHFFGFQKDKIDLAPGEEKQLRFLAANERAVKYTLKIGFWTSAADMQTAEIEVERTDEQILEGFSETSAIYGRITDEQGNPLSGVLVQAHFYSFREGYSTESNEGGEYAVLLPAVEDLVAFYGDKPTLADPSTYYLSASLRDYEFHFAPAAPTRSQPLEQNITLQKVQTGKAFKIKWEQQVEESFGFFWAMADLNFENILAVQAKHPPELSTATNHYVYDGEGNLKFTIPTGDECWGADVSLNGEFLALGCHDNKAYIYDRSGNVLLKKDCGGMNREIELSSDGKYYLTGPASGGDFAVFETATDKLVFTSEKTDEWLRNSRFSLDSSYIVAGLTPDLVGYSISGEELWRHSLGEFPLFLAMDQDKNVYASGKSRTLFKYDQSGNLIWQRKMPYHTVSAGDLSENGLIAVGTVGGMVYVYDTDGNLKWARRINGESIGHNAVSFTPDGRYVVVGTGPDNEVAVYDGETGTKLWAEKIEPSPNEILDAKYATIGETASRSSQEGVMHVNVSADATKIVAAYGDNWIRFFEETSAEPTSLEYDETADTVEFLGPQAGGQPPAPGEKLPFQATESGKMEEEGPPSLFGPELPPTEPLEPSELLEQ